MKKQICAAICSMLLLTALSMAPAFGGTLYSDLGSSHWAYPQIQSMSEKGIIAGYDDGSFKPDRPVTYAEYMKMIYIASNDNVLDQPGDSHWAAEYYTECIKTGIFSGNDVKISDLDEVIPRNKMALMVFNSVSTEDLSSSELSEILGRVNDTDVDSEYSYEIAWSYSKGILNGYPDGSFRPEKGLSRAEAAVSVFRMMENIDKGDDVRAELEGESAVSSASGEIPVMSYETRLGFNGITRFEYIPATDCIAVHSDRIQDILLFIDNVKADKVVNVSGEYWEKDGEYIYAFKAGGKYRPDVDLALSFGHYIEEVYHYKDAV